MLHVAIVMKFVRRNESNSFRISGERWKLIRYRVAGDGKSASETIASTPPNQFARVNISASLECFFSAAVVWTIKIIQNNV